MPSIGSVFDTLVEQLEETVAAADGVAVLTETGPVQLVVEE